MRKILIIIFSVAAFTVHAQTSKYALGLMAGLDYTKPTNDNSAKSKTGYLLGLNLSRNLGNRFFIQSGIWYIQKGYISKNSWFNTEMTIKDLEIPLLIGIKLGRKKISFVPNLGFSVAFNLQKKYKIIDNTPLASSYSYNQRESVAAPQRINFYLNLGIKYSFNEKIFMVFTPYYKVDLKNLINQGFNIDPTQTVGLNLAFWYN